MDVPERSLPHLVFVTSRLEVYSRLIHFQSLYGDIVQKASAHGFAAANDEILKIFAARRRRCQAGNLKKDLLLFLRLKTGRDLLIFRLKSFLKCPRFPENLIFWKK